MSGRNSDDIPEQRRAEYDGVVELLMTHADPPCEEAREAAERIAQASLKPGHLWREMGMGSRVELRSLIEECFPTFADGNDRDMRWKNYLYKRLCGWPGFGG